MHFNQNQYQKNQIKVIEELEARVKNNDVNFSLVSAVDDYKNDPRICLTSVHFPNEKFINAINTQIIDPLKALDPSHFYYDSRSFHITITGIRKVSQPKTYSNKDIEVAQEVLDRVLQKYKTFNVFFFKLVILPTNLSLFGTSDEMRDEMFIELNKELKKAGVPNDNQYLNSKYFFCNMTICRFSQKPSAKFVNKVQEINKTLEIESFEIDSVSLIEANASLGYCKEFKRWELGK